MATVNDLQELNKQIIEMTSTYASIDLDPLVGYIKALVNSFETVNSKVTLCAHNIYKEISKLEALSKDEHPELVSERPVYTAEDD